MHYIVEQSYLPGIKFLLSMHNLNVLLVKHVNNIVVFLGCVLLFDANFEYSAFKMRFEPLINFLCNLIFRKMKLL